MTDHVVVATGLCKKFGRVEAVKNATYSVRRGRITALLGENGAGKTTTLKLLLGFLKSDSGRMEKESVRMGYVPEHPVFFDWLKGSEMVEYTARRYKIDSNLLQDRITRHCEQLSFNPDLLSRKVQTFSLGNQKKFAFLLNLLISPDFLVVDEPFNSLDPSAIKNIRDLFQELKKEGKTLLVSTHLISEVEKIIDEFIIIKEGCIVLQANLNHFLEKYVLIEVEDGCSPQKDIETISTYVKKRQMRFCLLVERKNLNLAEKILLRKPSLKICDLNLETIFLFFSS